MSITAEQAKAALETVVDPTFEKTLGELGSLSEVRVEGDVVHAKVRISSPSDDVKSAIEQAIGKSLDGKSVSGAQVEWDVRIPTREATSEDPIPEVRNVILVMSGKGGVGKSTVSTNLVLALKRAGLRVGLLDADIYGPSIPTMFGIQGRPHSKDGQKITPLERFDVKLMSVGFLLEDDKQAVIWRGPMLHGALQQFITDVDWGPLDFLVLDLPPGTGDVALTLAQKVKLTGAVIVTTPQEVALQDVYKGVSMCKKLSIPVLGVVENMSHFVDSAGVIHELFGSGGGQKVAEFAGTELLGQIPIDTQVREWGDQGMPVVQSAPDSDVAQAFVAVAESLSEKVAKEHFARSGGETAPSDTGAKRLKIIR